MALSEFSIDKIIEAGYINRSNGNFTNGDLNNRLSAITQESYDVVYSHKVANEYTNIGGQSVWAAGWALPTNYGAITLVCIIYTLPCV